MILNFNETTIFSKNDQTITIIKGQRNFKPLRKMNTVYISEEDFDKLCKQLDYVKNTKGDPKWKERLL